MAASGGEAVLGGVHPKNWHCAGTLEHVVQQLPHLVALGRVGRWQALEPEAVLKEVPPFVPPRFRLPVSLVRHGLCPPCTAAETVPAGCCGLHTCVSPMPKHSI